MPGVIEAGVPTLKAFMVYDFGVDDATLLRALATAGERGGMLEVHCENRTILETLTARHLAAGETAPRYHASSRPPYVEAEATERAIALAQAADAPLYVVHLSSASALEAVRRGRATGQTVFAETCPHYLTLTDERYDAPPEEAARYVISPPLRAPGNPEALWDGLADGSLALIATDHVPDRASVEKQSWRESFDKISNGGPGIETLLTMAYDGGVAAGRITVERLVDVLSTTPARLFGLRSKGAIEVGRDADLVLFDPAARRTIRATDLHHTSDYTPYEGREVGGRRALDDRPRLVRRPRRRVRRHPRLRPLRRAPPRPDALGPADRGLDQAVRLLGRDEDVAARLAERRQIDDPVVEVRQPHRHVFDAGLGLEHRGRDQPDRVLDRLRVVVRERREQRLDELRVARVPVARARSRGARSR